MEQIKTDITNSDSARGQSIMSVDREKLNKQIAMRKRIIRQNYRFKFWFDIVSALMCGLLSIAALVLHVSSNGVKLFFIVAFWLIWALSNGYKALVAHKVLHAGTSQEMLACLEDEEQKSKYGLYGLSVPVSLLVGVVLMRWCPLYLAVLGGIAMFALWIRFIMFADKKNKAKKPILDPEIEKLQELELKAQESV